MNEDKFKHPEQLTDSYQEKENAPFDTKQMEMGNEVEKEHTDTINWLISNLGIDPNSDMGKRILKIVISKISKDHLKEIAKYYTYLKEMENKHG